MSSRSRKKRKVYGAIRDFDDIFRKENSESDSDKDVENSNENNSASSSDYNESDFRSSCDDDRNKYEYHNANNIKNSVYYKKDSSTEASDIKFKKKKGTKRCRKIRMKQTRYPEEGSRFDDSLNDVTIKVESDSGDNEAGTRKQRTSDATDLDSFDVVLSSSMITGAGGFSDNQCTLLVEVSFSKDAVALGEFGGSIGAIGRFESDPSGITLDLKGNQYRGSLLPGPSCLVVGFPQSFGIRKREQSPGTNLKQVQDDEEEGGKKLRVEGVTDEYVTLVQIDDHMKKLDAIVTGNKNDSNNRVTELIGGDE